MSELPPHETRPGVDPATVPGEDQATRPMLQPPPPYRGAPRQQQRLGSPPPGTAPRRPPAAGYAPPPAPVVQPRRRPPTPPSESGLYLPWWSLLVMVGIVGMAAFVLLIVFDQVSEPQTPGNQAPRIQVVTSLPTLSQDFGGQASQPEFWPTPIPRLAPSATVALPTPVPSPSLPPGEFAVGSLVQVVGVEGSGLNVRDIPGTGGTPRFLAAEGETFVIVDGPQNVDNMEWWHLEDPDNANRFGWAVRNYLTIASQ